MSKHSPAPWSIRQSATHVTVVTASGDAVFHDDKRLTGAMEDARLIAAAPELLEALAHLEFAAQCRDNTMGDPSRLIQVKAELASAARQARDAIAKATGEKK